MEGLLEQLLALEDRYRELSLKVIDPSVIADADAYRSAIRDFKQLEPIVEQVRQYKQWDAALKEAQADQKSADLELREMASEEAAQLTQSLQQLRRQLQEALVPDDPSDGRDCVIEVRAGTGGDEAALWAGDVFRMYQRFAESLGWKLELIGSHPGTAGGFKEIVARVSGQSVFGHLKYESGTHRVQRVPATESQGRIHTSAATVAILPEADVVDFELNTKDIRKDTFRASGAGGQHVNKTESAVRLTHLPTGVVVECQDGRSQHQNYEQALTVMRTRLWEAADRERRAVEAAERKSQVGTGDRSGKIRTYNYPQGRVTDHRIGLTVHALERVLSGELGDIVQALRNVERTERLKQAGLSVDG
ncbi:MAG: peptide chain release factor 1 [Flavobacteriales bacterium]|jgi:peptide chain release factor 1|nr:peptide chain release factor 1 [Flavobacteriales bacterium]